MVVRMIRFEFPAITLSSQQALNAIATSFDLAVDRVIASSSRMLRANEVELIRSWIDAGPEWDQP